MPTGKLDIRSRFLAQIAELQAYGKQRGLADTPPRWFTPDRNGWDGDIFNITGMSKAFDRTEHAEDFQTVVRDGADPGTVSDLIGLQLQSDFLSMLERAYRERHKSSVRSSVQALGRLRGHSHPAGVIERGLRGRVEQVIKLGRS